LRNIRPLTDPLLDPIDHTILVMAISCKGQEAIWGFELAFAEGLAWLVRRMKNNDFIAHTG